MEALLLTEAIVNSKYLHQNKISICFTHYDIFETKIKSGLFPLPDYEGPPTDVIACRDFIFKKFIELSRRHDSVDVFYINATDPEYIKDVVNATLAQIMPGSN